MMIPDPFWMTRLKIQRAATLIKDVAAELENYRLNPAIEHSVGHDDDGWYAETKIICGPVLAGPIIGDVVHNLRASLDLMASELARINQMSDKGVYFPISDSENSLDDQIKRKNFNRSGADAVALLKSFAPYRGGNIPLRALHDLDIEDKHKTLVPTTQQIKTVIDMPYRDGLIMPSEAIVTHDPASLKLVFPDGSPFAGDEIVPTLEKLVELVDGIVKAFASLVVTRGDHSNP